MPKNSAKSRLYTTASYKNARGFSTQNSKKWKTKNISGDARDKLIQSRRTGYDARQVIRNKVGDLRSVISQKSVTINVKKGYQSFHDAPMLVYAEPVGETLNRKQAVLLKNPPITVGRTEPLIISRRRGYSMEADTISSNSPMHSKRQASPPSARQRSPISREAFRRPLIEDDYTQNDFPSVQHRTQQYWNHDTRSSHDAIHQDDMLLYKDRSRSPIARYDDYHYRRSPSPPVQPPISQNSLRSKNPWSQSNYVDGRTSGNNYNKDIHHANNYHPTKYSNESSAKRSHARQFSDEQSSNQNTYHLKEPHEPYHSGASYQMYADNGKQRNTRNVNNKSTAQRPSTERYILKVTNLADGVTEDDVKELFNDIGPIEYGRLISKGHAEVCYKNKIHAKTAIEKYDRRELDGVPMKIKALS